MASYNKVILIGNLTRDVAVRYISSGKAVAEIGLAVNNSYTDKASGQKRDDTVFVDVTLWGRTAELAGEYLAKGKPVMVDGRLVLDSWDDKATGTKRTKLKVVGETIQFLGGGDGERRAPARQQEKSAAQVDDSGFDDGGISDDVPF